MLPVDDQMSLYVRSDEQEHPLFAHLDEYSAQTLDISASIENYTYMYIRTKKRCGGQEVLFLDDSAQKYVTYSIGEQGKVTVLI